MGDTKGGDTKKQQQQQQHLTNSTTSSSPPTHPQQTAAAAAVQDSSTDSIPHHIVGVITSSSFLPPLYTNISTHVSPTVVPITSFDQNQMFDHLASPATTASTTTTTGTVINTNPKRPRYTSAGQWKLLPAPSSSLKQILPYVAPVVLSNESTPSPSAPSNQPAPSTAAAASSSDTAASSPSHPSLSGSAASAGQECTNISEAGGEQDPLQQQQQHLQMRKGKIVSPPWKPNEALWLARAWRIQYEGGSKTSQQEGQGQAAGRSGTKTRAEKDQQVSDYLKSHGVNRDAKQAGTKWDNMLGDYRKVYKWERCGGRDQTGRSYFRLSQIERKDYNLPASFDEEVYEELCQFMGSRMRTLISTTRPVGLFDDSRPSHMVIRSLPPPPIFHEDHDIIPLTTRAKQLGLTSGAEAFGHGGRGSLLGYDTSCSTDAMAAPSRELKRVGKARMIWEESVNLWGEEGEHHRGRVKLQGLNFLNADELTYLDDSMVACTLETFEDATPLKGFSVDRFVCGQQIKVFGRRKSSSSSAPPPPPPPVSFSGFHDRIQLPSTEPSIRSISAWEFQDPTDYYLGCLKIPPPTLPSLVELSWHLQEPPAEELRFPLRKDVYRDLPQGKELFFTTSNELLDCRAIIYEILCPIIRPNPSLTASTATTRESFIGLWDDCINRLISKFCSLEIIFLRKPSSLSVDDTIQDQWPNLTAFVRNFCLWRGEETDQVREGHVDPSNLIVEKISWTYMDLPYVLGYYAVGYTATFCAFSQSQDSNNIIRTDLYTLDLSTPAERLKALIPCWRIAGLLPLLAERCLLCINKVGTNLKHLPYSDFERICSSNGNVIEMTPNTVTKYFSNKRKWYAVKEIYDFLDQRIPHSEIIFGVSEKDLALTFKPRGCKFKPRNSDQLIQALKCVTKALVALHDLSFMHRDLDWDKVVYNRDNNVIEWFVTGFEEAVGAPQIYPHAVASGKHAPEMGRGMHGVKVDVWGVGMLVKRSGLVSIPKLLRELQNRCLDPNPEQRPTAADCYHHLLQLHSSMPPAPAEYNV